MWMLFHPDHSDPKLYCGMNEWSVLVNESVESKAITYGYKMQTDIADEMIENGIETDS